MAEKSPRQSEPVMDDESADAASCEVGKATVNSTTTNATPFNDITGFQAHFEEPIPEFIVHGTHVRRPVWV